MSHRITQDERWLLEAITKFCSVEQVFNITSYVLDKRKEHKTASTSTSKPEWQDARLERI